MGEPHRAAWRRWRRRALRPLATQLPGGAALLPAPRPLPLLRTPHPGGQSRELLVFLPGIDELPGDFRRHGLIDAAWQAGVAADAVEPDLHLGYFLRGCAVQSLYEDVIRPATARGYRHLWLVGLSLGGFAALRYLEAHDDDVEGVILLAPAVGPLGREVREPMARGSELPGPLGQRVIWEWLAHRPAGAPVYLAFGDRDPFAPGHRLLAELLPREQVFSAPGGHDWSTWSELWSTLLARVLTQRRHA